jgi:hypothetical protein
MTGRDSRYFWLLEDVPLRTYYKEAGRFAWLGRQKDIERRREVDEFYELDDDYDDDLFDPDGFYHGVTPHMFRGLPNLRLFHGHYRSN